MKLIGKYDEPDFTLCLITTTEIDKPIKATANELKKIFGLPTIERFNPKERIQNIWPLSFDFGNEVSYYTICDFEEYRRFTSNEMINWQIRANEEGQKNVRKFFAFVNKKLKELRK